MKKLLKSLLQAFLIIGISGTIGFAITCGEILKKIDEVEKYDYATMEITQIITTSDGDKRTLKMKFWGKNTGDKQLSEYTYPKRIKGVKFLMLNDGNDIWSYSPRTKRTRHLASHAKKQKVMGSDFTYEDMGGGKMSEKYNGKILKEEKYDNVNCFVIELIPTDKGPGYDKIILWVEKKDFATRRIDYFEDGSPKVFKTLYLKNIQKISGHFMAMEMTMKNFEDGGETYNKTTKVDFDSKISDGKFNARRLGRR